MRSRKLITTLALTAVMLALVTMPAMAYTIDGNLSDWGITSADLIAGLAGDKDAWKPTNDTVDWIVEDNNDPDRIMYAVGVHIKGNGPYYEDYDEPEVWHKLVKEWIPEPTYAGYASPAAEEYDIEAMYFDDDEYCNVYFAFVVSGRENRGSNLGDLAIDLDPDGDTGEYGYEFGIKLNDLTLGTVATKDVMDVSDWSEPTNVDTAPLGIVSGTPVGNATVAFKDSGISDHGYSNYILEIKVPDAYTVFGNIPKDTLSNMHFTITTCGNDHVEREVKFDYEHIPEFSTIAIPVGMIFGLFYFYRRKRQSREE